MKYTVTRRIEVEAETPIEAALLAHDTAQRGLTYDVSVTPATGGTTFVAVTPGQFVTARQVA